MTLNIKGSHGAQIKLGDGGVGAGTKASLTKGSSNSQIVIGWGKAGTVGNGKQVTIVESGNATPLSVVVTPTSVVINLETDGSGDSVSTVNDVIAKLYQDATFAANWFATDGAGDGTGVLAAATVDVLAGGAAGTPVYTLIEGIFNGPNGPNNAREFVSARHHSSPATHKKPTVAADRRVTFSLYFDRSNAQHAALELASMNGTKLPFQQFLNEETEKWWEYEAYVTVDFSADVDGLNTAAVEFAIDGELYLVEEE